MPTRPHCLTVFDEPDRQIVVSFNKTLVGKDFSSYLGCWETNHTYHCGEILLSISSVNNKR